MASSSTSFDPSVHSSSFMIQNNERVFYPVGGPHQEKMGIIEDIFDRILTPLYGNQDKAIRQIRESTDRACYLLYEGEVPSGVLVFKTVLSNEFSEYGITNSVEIKSLFVDHSLQNSGRGLGSNLVDKLKEEVRKLGLGENGIHVTVSETKQESLAFFRKKGFDISHAWKGRYLADVTEYLLYCPTRIEQAQKEIHDFTERFSHLHVEGDQGEVPELFHIIHNAHFGDIHSFTLLSDGTFISGSKDNSLRKWNQNGELVRIVDDVEPTMRKDQDWITAVEVINDEYWASGERSGRISLWKTNGDYVKDILLRLPRPGDHISHEYNARRVNCFASGLNRDKPSLYVGFPTMFDEFNFIEGRTETLQKVHKNDWVYCLKPLTNDRILAVTGCAVEAWQRRGEGWRFEDTILPEGPRKRLKSNGKWINQRPFISSLKQLKSSENHFGLAVFDGSVKVLDIAQKTIVRNWTEHNGRVWAIENLTQHVFASSGEDRTIKIWDQRQERSVHSINDHVGQVTSLLSLKEHVLIAGTCPEKALTSQSGAEIRFYDIRS